MSALPLKADIFSALAHVCFGPEADITAISSQARLRVIYRRFVEPAPFQH
jgi:hypothetical protein